MPDRSRKTAGGIRGQSPYPERATEDPSFVDLALAETYARVALRFERHAVRLARHARIVDALAPEFRSLSDTGLRDVATQLRQPLLRHGFRDDLVARSFALVREVSRRRLGMSHFPVQIMGGWAMMQGKMAEMATGEGKTITAVLPAVTAALAGMPVHVITVNDYLAARDAEELRPIYDGLGLTVGAVQHGQDTETRRAVYACDVAYVVNKEVAFDYLKDGLALGPRRSLSHTAARRMRDDSAPRPLLRGLCFAIVDEADSILIDEARTPLIISGAGSGAIDDKPYVTALALARQLVPVDDFQIVPDAHSVRLTSDGSTKLKVLAKGFGGLWEARRAREQLICQALSAFHLYHRDQHYVISDGKVQIVDEFSGRIAEGRTWQHGLHQLIELKEGCEITAEVQTQSSITYQRFFRKYLHLSGMSGTIAEVAAEVQAVYGVPIARIPTNRPSRRASLGTRLFHSSEQKWAAIISAVQRQQQAGRPVLVGSRSIAASEQISSALTTAKIEHVVLNAHHDDSEAAIVARAGHEGRVTVATNMAGRGTDIKLDRGIEARGGLHVILTEFHESSRIDRQLIGRGGRQGDPSTFETIVALDDELFTRYAPRLTALLRGIYATRTIALPDLWAGFMRRHAQRVAERLHYRSRRQALRFQKERDKSLAFAKPE